MPKEKKERQAKENTIERLAEILISQGPEAALAALGRQRSLTNPTFKIPGDQGEPVQRRDAAPREDLNVSLGHQYWDFSPPTHWQPPVTILRVRFSKGEIDHYMHHAGEEILVPIAGSIRYAHLLPDGSLYKLKRQIGEVLRPGDIYRCQPSVPHNTWGASDDAEAWMIFRDSSANPAAIKAKVKSTMTTQQGADSIELNPRTVTAKTYADSPEKYVMDAFGISQGLRHHRMTADLQIAEVATRCRLDRAQMSKIENGLQNVAVETLARLGEELGFDPLEALLQPLWGSKKASFAAVGKKSVATKNEEITTALAAPSGDFLKPRFFHIPQDKEVVLNSPTEKDPFCPHRLISSWIVLSGEAKFEYGDSGKEYVDAGGVIHFKNTLVKSIKAQEETRLLEVCCSAIRNGGHQG